MHDIPQVKKNEYFSDTFGVSIPINDLGSFEYWAAIDKKAVKKEEFLESITLPAGLYASIKSNKLEELPKAFEYIYRNWINEQNIYSIDYSKPFFEKYGKDYLKDSSYEIFVAVCKK